MSPQFADFDSDGRLDLVVGIFDGSPHVALGSPEGFGAPQQILDRDGARIVLNAFWNFETKKWDATRRYDAPNIETPEGQATSAVAWDWDADGDLDLLLGDYKSGRIYRRRNLGRAGAPAFEPLNLPLEIGGKPFSWPGKIATLRLHDWDGDGLSDLVFGAVDGRPGSERGADVGWLRNTGRPGDPSFAAPQIILPGVEVRVRDGSAPNHGLYPEVGDLDGDGKLDLLVGGQSSFTPSSRKLEAAERTRVRELRAELAKVTERRLALNRRMAAAQAGLSGDAAAAKRKEFLAAEKEAYDAIAAAEDPLRKEIESLEPSPKTVNGVWFFRRES
jgi:hypothetical protein